MSRSSQPNAETHSLEENIKRTVATSALKKIRALVDRENAQQAFADRFVKRFLIFMAVGVLLLGAVVFFYGAGSVSRPLTALGPMTESNAVSGKATVTIAPPTESTSRTPVTAPIGNRVADFSVASYVEQWRNHIETYATANYPNELKGAGFRGSNLVMVTIKSDGTLNGVSIAKSSGNEKLDSAAIALVRNAAPYPKFSPQLAARVDVIEMTRAFHFPGTEQR